MPTTSRLIICLLAISAFAPGDSAVSATQDRLDAPAALLSQTCQQDRVTSRMVTPTDEADAIVLVDEFGSPTSVQSVIKITDAAAFSELRTYLMSCRFQPALSSGEPVKGTARIVFIRPTAMAENILIPERPAIIGITSCAPKADDYPPESLRQNEQGTTRLKFTVAPTGQLTAFGIAKSSGYLRLDFAALVALVGCRFKSGRTAEGLPVISSFVVDYAWIIR